jgi:hypothetical protein
MEWGCHYLDQAISHDSRGESRSHVVKSIGDRRSSDEVRDTTKIDHASDHDVRFGFQDTSPFLNEDCFGEFINWSETSSESQDVVACRQGPAEGDCLEETRLRGIRSNLSKRKSPENSNVAGRKQRRKMTMWSGYSETSLVKHVDRERTRCQNLQIIYVDPVWHPSSTQAKYQLPLETFYFGLGSSESICLLLEMLAAQRKSTTDVLPPASGLSTYQRLEVIERLDERISYYGFLRRCHVHQLVLDCCGANRLALDGFVPHTFTGIGEKNRTKKGNPFNIADSELTISMLENLWPALHRDSSQYKKKYEQVTRLRQLGQRLAHIVDRFGFGILGLIPSSLESSCTDVQSSA